MHVDKVSSPRSGCGHVTSVFVLWLVVLGVASPQGVWNKVVVIPHLGTLKCTIPYAMYQDTVNYTIFTRSVVRY